MIVPFLLAWQSIAQGSTPIGLDAATLQAHVKFLASDALEGRGTPSRGLNIAAEYIASNYQRFDLEAPVEKSYFQWAVVRGRDGIDSKAANVVGVIPGSDPKLKEQAIIVTAHYDHLGKTEREQDDQIFNGANDDASGTACVLGLAEAFARGPKPKRTLIFVALYGEERGLLGSRHYIANPIWPLKSTIANLNLEHMGRTDDSDGPQFKSVNLTGFDFSDMASFFVNAGKASGVKFWKHEKNSDGFFARSDNAAFAMAGIPAHTMSVAYVFPDYHGAGDHWDKVDYGNMSTVLTAIYQGLTEMANSPNVPKWDQTNPKVQRYRDAYQKLQGGS